MALRTIVKASISGLTDARYFAAFGVDFLGLNFDPLSPDYLKPEDAIEIKNWISGPEFIAEFNNQDSENIENICAFIQPDYVQLSSAYTITDFDYLNIPIIYSVIMEEQMQFPDLEQLLGSAAGSLRYLMLDFRSSQIDSTWLHTDSGWQELIKRLADTYDLLLAMDFTKETLLDAIENLPISGLNVFGSKEELIGLKLYDTFDELMAVLEMES